MWFICQSNVGNVKFLSSFVKKIFKKLGALHDSTVAFSNKLR